MLYELRDLKQIHSEQTILDIPYLDVMSGMIYSLTGPNGAGKTTLLNILAFLDPCSQGTVIFRSQPIQYGNGQLLALRKKVVLVDQYPLLFTGPVWKNVEFGLKVRGIDAKKRKSMVDEALERVGMQNFYYAEAQTLSGGETKRIALARALVIRPDVLLCDEPTANVDKENQGIILSLLEQMSREEKTSIIFSTHSLSQAQRLATQTITLDAGRLVTPAGENVFEATVYPRDEHSVLCKISKRFQLALGIDSVGRSTGAARLLVDAEKIRVLPSADETGNKNVFRGNVVSLLREKDHVRIEVESDIRLVIRQTETEYRDFPRTIGEKVLFEIPDDALHVSGQGFR